MRYDRSTPMHQILEDVHSKVATLANRIKKQQEAFALQAILQQIKYTAKLMRQNKKVPVTSNYFFNEYSQLIQDAFNIQNQARIQNGYSKLGSQAALFYRGHFGKTSSGNTYGTKSFADDIFEEQLASIFAALDKKASGGKVSSIDVYLTGQKSSGTAAMSQVSKNLQQETMNIIKLAAQKHGKTIDANLATNRAIKADINRVEMNINYDNLTGQLAQLHRLTAGKTFSLKNYSAYKQTTQLGDIKYSNKSLGLGDSNLYKSITGSLSLAMTGRSARSVLHRGMQILAGESVPPDTDIPENISRHFAHLRFIYQLSGAGLIADNGKLSLVDYIIYNDPSSENIAVRDIGSIILEQMNNKNRTNLFSGEVEIAASRIFANPVKKNN